MFTICVQFSILMIYNGIYLIFFFFKQKTAYEMRISDWSSDVCSSDLDPEARDALSVTLELENGDREQVTLTETASNSGEFVGLINTIGVPPGVAQGDCRLSVEPGAPLALRVTDQANASLVALATINFLVDPFGLVFDSGEIGRAHV